MKRRVVITGMGIVSALGNEVKKAFDNSVNGYNCVDYIDGFDTSDLKVKIAAFIKEFDAAKHLSKRDIRRQDLFSQYALYAAKEAFIDANLENNYDPLDMGVIIGSGMGGMQTFAADLNKAFEGGYGKIPPMFIPMIIPNMASGNVSIALNAKNHSSATTTACAAASHAIGEGFRHIQHGYSEIMVVGGSEAGVNPYTIAGFSALTALSSNPDPNNASRPFDENRDGFILGEGAGVLILESLEHAKARNTHIYGEVVGFGSSSDAYHITAPSGDGAKRAMELALADAEISADAIDYINAHGTSTPLNDKFEAAAINELFSHKPLVSSTKSMHGHALGATGAIEAILSVMAINEELVPPTINLVNVDAECDLNHVKNQAVKNELDYVMSNSLGFGGHNAVLIFRKFRDE